HRGKQVFVVFHLVCLHVLVRSVNTQSPLSSRPPLRGMRAPGYAPVHGQWHGAPLVENVASLPCRARLVLDHDFIGTLSTMSTMNKATTGTKADINTVSQDMVSAPFVGP